jgi:hypothetical protein
VKKLKWFVIAFILFLGVCFTLFIEIPFEILIYYPYRKITKKEWKWWEDLTRRWVDFYD